MKETTNNPYLAGQQEVHDRHVRVVNSLRQWQFVAVGCVIAAIVSTLGLLYTSSKQTVVPYLVEYNQHSEPMRIIRLDTPNTPSTNQIKAGLRTWLIGARSVIGDKNAMKDVLEQTYMMTLPGSEAYKELHDYHTLNNPYAIEDYTVNVDVHSVLLLGGDTWQIDWTEKKRGRASTQPTQWQARVTVKTVAPATEEQIMRNPGGIFVSDLYWTQRL